MKHKAKLISIVLLTWGIPLLASGDSGHFDHYDWGHFVPWVVNFLIFFGGLGFILRKPVGEFFSSRRSEIENSLSAAEQSVAEANAALEEIEAESKALEKEVGSILEQAKADAAEEKNRLIEQAKKEVARIHEQAKLEVESMRKQAAASLKSFLADQAVVQAEAIIKESMSDAERKKLFADFTGRLGAKS